MLASLALAGCLSGGGGGDDDSGNGLTPPTTPPTGNNTPPTISGRPSSSATVGESYSFTPAANDADGDNLTFSIANMPDWMSFDSSTGAVAGTPSMGDVGTYNGILISVTDGQSTVSVDPFGCTENSKRFCSKFGPSIGGFQDAKKLYAPSTVPK